MYDSMTGGTKPMSITGRMVKERERLAGMTNDERAWRAQWLKDQNLSHSEPKYVPEYWKEIRNPIRRFYQAPLNVIEKTLTPVLGHTKAFGVRFWAGKALMTVTGIYLIAYYFKYNTNDWTRKGGWRVISSRRAVNPGDPGFPKLSDRSKGEDYADRGFKKSVL